MRGNRRRLGALLGCRSSSNSSSRGRTPRRGRGADRAGDEHHRRRVGRLGPLVAYNCIVGAVLAARPKLRQIPDGWGQTCQRAVPAPRSTLPPELFPLLGTGGEACSSRFSTSFRELPSMTIASPLDLPALVSDRLEVYLRETWVSVVANLARVKAAAERYAALDYPRDTPAFSYLYFPANFAKTFRVASHVRPGRTIGELVDLGAGLGASCGGAMEAFRRLGCPVERVTVVDSSRAQLELFERVTLPWLRESFVGTKVDIIESDVTAWTRRSGPRPDCAIASYLLCEQNVTHRGHTGAYLAEIVRRGGISIVTDTFDGASAFWFNGQRGRFAPNDIAVRVPFLARLRCRILPKYAMPPTERARSLRNAS